MQVLQPTWNGILARHRIPPGGASPPSRYNPHDAIYAAAYYLCDNGATRDLPAAVFAYNHSHHYVTDVLAQAARYTDQTTSGSVTCGTVPPADGLGTGPGDAAAVAVGFACAQLGKPYILGGNGNPGLRLLRTHPRRLRHSRHRHPAYRPNPIRRWPPAPGRNPAGTRGPRLLRHPQPHPPRRNLPRRHPHDRRPRRQARP